VDLMERWQRGEPEVLSEDECRKLLATRTVGRLAYNDDTGPVVTPLNYAVSDGAVLLATSPTTQLAARAPGAWVALEVDDLDMEGRSGWSVLVRGRAEVVDYTELPAAHGARPAPWVAGDRTTYLRIVPASTTGRRLSPA
jgi:nitroimidazol reductase NimA-like FMN-containing flavoprotein (pyridoxamine 5'-phosphate oxidase superfamily)